MEIRIGILKTVGKDSEPEVKVVTRCDGPLFDVVRVAEGQFGNRSRSRAMKFDVVALAGSSEFRSGLRGRSESAFDSLRRNGIKRWPLWRRRPSLFVE